MIGETDPGLEKDLASVQARCVELTKSLEALVGSLVTIVRRDRLENRLPPINKNRTTPFSAHELAERWCMSEGTLAHWRIEGKGPKYHKIGKRAVYPVVEVEQFEKSQLKRSTAQ